ncbi:pyrimidine 5'-nucleotidase [Sphingomonas sp.]|uniref:pyrimidine 5'-nucleotidase n=1 Tax=Sphingomonas sp. TaxID=28214 RepID=UPI001B110858|nr:pyrimidine 5'-nucleotidase [Sphingomonas sp.]MBO9714436.1 pyrimidine 5'-nucleotidase [Sphingomonas sp.]
MLAPLSHVRNWIFDLDNTLYPASANLFARVDVRMRRYISDLLGVDEPEAERIQKAYFFDHGTTLAGLMAHHGVDPHHYLDFVHDIGMEVLERNEPLAAAIARLPGRKLIFTNADTPYAERVLALIGLADSFEAIHDVHATDYRPKPDPIAYQGLCDAYGLDAAQSLFVEDLARNLQPAKAIGMTTVWVDNGSEQAPGERDLSYIDFVTADITGWLHDIMKEDA